MVVCNLPLGVSALVTGTGSDQANAVCQAAIDYTPAHKRSVLFACKNCNIKL